MKTEKTKLWLFSTITALTMLVGSNALAQADGQPKAQIDITKDGEMWKIVGLYINNEEPRDSLRYSLKVERVGKSGKSANSQGGHFEAQENEEVNLSTVQINVAEGDVYNLTLVVYKSDEEILCEKKLSSED